MVNLPIEYSSKKVTPFGGMSLMKRFIDQTEIREQLAQLDLPQPSSNAGYNPAHITEAFWLSIWTGASRYIHCDWLRYDSTLQDIFGWNRMPSQSTYSRFFGKFSQKRNTEVFPKLQHWFFKQLDVDNLTIDFDSTVITRYGEQQGSAKGYNPNKKGRNSHHPLMAFVSQTRMVANAWLRPGNTADSSSCKEFMEETFNEALKDKRVGLVRADSGFYTQDLLDYLEGKQLNYIMAARMYPNIKNAVWGLDNWIELTKGIELNEMIFNHTDGKSRRYIVIKKKVEDRPKAAGKLLFDDLPGYRFSCYVTNLDLPLDQVWNIYNTRADCENRIKELKEDFGLDNFCLKDFWATEASFRFIMVAYNLMSLFRHFALNHHNRATLKTLKVYCFALGAWTVNHANRKVLKIALNTKKRPWMDGLFSQINDLSPPFVYS
ncbi:IS1380 family transposase [Polaribacter batillariae]|uniref:IS1380 family transposase n=1 Tax=Polaribacter batillariae TaxID=2808900 RepID=A0ABX7STZ9_9FLAO|nr:IS1380 family transposase [Polaribacter batillariae]QTD37150.1 IS1380 family transposase [Polaribacter batillariae]QTD37583.1 IS1380 family transposase [Polaribacter batillariae]QTD37709.1 IS1380 family transposase [Polaribacter batillariae]QTD37719.1 IS1380 family transposase [Polaribacter batillariae]QTD38021.1 IS1380 family transposase [Polaribacter batillariae]